MGQRDMILPREARNSWQPGTLHSFTFIWTSMLLSLAAILLNISLIWKEKLLILIFMIPQKYKVWYRNLKPYNPQIM